MKRIILGVAVLALSVTVNIAVAAAQMDSQSIVRPGSPQAAEFLQKLKEAEYSDRGNSHSYTSDDPSVGHYYAREADEVSALIERLEGGQSVPREEIQNALDNSEARFY
jgi:hypothetical protein